MKFIQCLTLSALAVGTQAPAGETVFKRWDQNGDGFLSREEVPAGPRKMFDRKDVNGDGRISLDEHLGRGGPPNRRPPNVPPPSRPRQSTRPATQPARPSGQADRRNATFTIRQTWPQEPDGFDRPVYALEPHSKSARTPVVIYFHGNGGDAGRTIKRWAKTFPNHLVVAPQGYSRSWNVQGETSLAPDVSLFRELVGHIGKRYPYADRKKVSIIGTSNGGALVYRLMIEVEEDLFQSAVPMVASLLEAQFHDGSFWKSEDESNTGVLELKAHPRSDPALRILYVHGTEDGTVPFAGGLRFGKYKHLSAYQTANTLARHHGYKGPTQTEATGKKIGTGLVLHSFAGTGLQFVAVTGGNHGLAPHGNEAREYVRKFIDER